VVGGRQRALARVAHQKSEARHFELYLDLARSVAPQAWRERLNVLAEGEAALVTERDAVFRFHSGPP
jgi:tRNA-(ms[2]io[6]A)-hydroxylase